MIRFVLDFQRGYSKVTFPKKHGIGFQGKRPLTSSEKWTLAFHCHLWRYDFNFEISRGEKLSKSLPCAFDGKKIFVIFKENDVLFLSKIFRINSDLEQPIYTTRSGDQGPFLPRSYTFLGRFYCIEFFLSDLGSRSSNNSYRKLRHHFIRSHIY